MMWAISISTLACLYFIGVLILLYNWRKIKDNNIVLPSMDKVSIVIAFRNEAKQLPVLLRAISIQNYPINSLEVILVNDHSEDNFEGIISAINLPFKLKVLSLSVGERGKKAALSKGIHVAEGEWILTSDADCSMGNEWVSSMMSHAKNHGAQFVFGPVCFRQHGNFKYDFQSIELSSLIGSGAALWRMAYPTMCNGANLLYKKSLVQDKNVYEGNNQLASGDDEFLMHKVFLEQARDVSFIKSKKALVETEASETWAEFFQQRKRWASKWGAYQLFHVKLIAMMVFLFNVAYVLLPFVLLMLENLMPWVLIAYLLRWLIDAIFLKEILCFYDKRFNLVSYVKLAIVYPYYVVLSGLAGRMGKYQWKGRTVS